MAKLDFYDVELFVGRPTDTHYEVRLRVLFEEGDDEQAVITTVTDKLQTEGLRIANAGYVDTIDRAL